MIDMLLQQLSNILLVVVSAALGAYFGYRVGVVSHRKNSSWKTKYDIAVVLVDDAVKLRCFINKTIYENNEMGGITEDVILQWNRLDNRISRNITALQFWSGYAVSNLMHKYNAIVEHLAPVLKYGYKKELDDNLQAAGQAFTPFAEHLGLFLKNELDVEVDMSVFKK